MLQLLEIVGFKLRDIFGQVSGQYTQNQLHPIPVVPYSLIKTDCAKKLYQHI